MLSRRVIFCALAGLLVPLKRRAKRCLPPGIVRVGECFQRANGSWVVQGWHFDCRDRAFVDYINQKVVGYTLEELREISLSFTSV